MSALDVPVNQLIKDAAQELKTKHGTIINPPSWVGFVKTSAHNERVPQEPDFWYLRCASLLFNSYKRGNIGVRRLRHKYGGRTQHTVSRSHHAPAGGKSIRLALQQLEKAGLMHKEKTGRVITGAGRSLLDKVSSVTEKHATAAHAAEAKK